MSATKWPGWAVRIGLRPSGAVTHTWIFYDSNPRARAEEELERRGMTSTHTIIGMEPGN